MTGAGEAVSARATGDFEAIGERVAGCFRGHGIETVVRLLDVETEGWRMLG